MSIKKAKTLDEKQINFASFYLTQNVNSLRNKVMFFLSMKNGLRAAEIAGLRWLDVTDAEGGLANEIAIGSHIGKGKKARTIPMHPSVREALLALRMERTKDVFISYSVHPKFEVMSANAVTLWFKRLYVELGFEGCSSHSGRRTAITTLAQKANWFDCSLVDVQQFAGHSHLTTTQRYIDYSQRAPELVASL